MIRFPEGFIWGASTAAYQIEGAAHEDGRGESIWDVFSREPGRVANGDTGDVACDHYHRYREDVGLLRDLGVDAYRFSVSWPRVLPTGAGRPNRKGLDFYARLVDELLAAGVAPWVCLYHWDLPQALQEKGGWTSRDTAERFADYAELVAAELGDRVGHFLMLNEPNVAALLGHLLGLHAPGLADLGAYAAATHHLNLAQGLGLSRLREQGDWQLGTILSLEPVHAAGDRDEDRQAFELYDAARNRNVLDPLLRGEYPEISRAMLEPFLHDGDLATIRQPVDLLGVNLYSRRRVRADRRSLVGLREVEPPEGAETTAMGWEVYPQALYEQLTELRDRYGNPPVVVTENGAAFDDTMGRGGRVRDPERVRYLAAYLAQMHRAIEEGADVRGYFVWSLLDNFEWAEGYDKRFGIVHVDYETLERTPKESFEFYKRVIAENSLDAEALSVGR